MATRPDPTPDQLLADGLARIARGLDSYLSEHDQDSVRAVVNAALWHELGKKTSLTKTGKNIVIKGRGRDGIVSDDPATAVDQLTRAGISFASLTPEELIGFTQWDEKIRTNRKHEAYKIVVTRAVSEGGKSVNKIKLLRKGQLIHAVGVPLIPDPQSLHTDLERHYIRDQARIEAMIESLKREYPDFAGACVEYR